LISIDLLESLEMVTGDLKFEGKQKGLSLKPDVLKNSKKKIRA
jgi:hypothetical protein